MYNFFSKDELKAIAAVAAKQTKMEICDTKEMVKECKFERTIPKVEDDENTEDLKDMLALPGDLLDTDLVNSIINEDDDELTKNTGSLEALGIILTSTSLFLVTLLNIHYGESTYGIRSSNGAHFFTCKLIKSFIKALGQLDNDCHRKETCIIFKNIVKCFLMVIRLNRLNLTGY